MIGVVVSPHARRHREDPGLTGALRAIVGARGTVAEAATPEALREIACAFRERGVDVLAVSGGDGSAGLALTAFAEVYGDAALPKFALLRGGTMNTVANGVGVPRLRTEEILRRLVARIASGLPLPVSRRATLRVSAPRAPTRLGFLFGMGLGAAFLEIYYALGGGDPTALTAVRTLATLAVRALAGGAGSARNMPLAVEICADGRVWPARRYAVVLAATVPEIGLGFRPFFRAREGVDAFHLVAVHGAPARIVARLGRVWRGLPLGADLAREALVRRALLSCAARELRYFVDGDLHRTTDAPCIETGPQVELLTEARGLADADTGSPPARPRPR